MRAIPVITLLSASAAVAVALAASAGPADATFDPAVLPPSVQPAWTMPWQLSPASAASRAQGERTFLLNLSGYGLVRGTSDALHYIFTSLPEQPGRNRLVRACRARVARGAAKFGSVQVEAASAGRERRTRDGGLIAPVAFRLTYARFNGRENYEVRQSTLTCQADRYGNILDARA